MKKLSLILAFMLLSIACVNAVMDCEIVSGNCGEGVAVLKISDIGEGGGHAGTVEASSFTYTVCCSGIPLKATTTKASNKFMISLSDAADGHASSIETSFGTDVYLESSAEVSCNYALENCLGVGDCLLSISDTTDAHVAGCDIFEKKLCCKEGAETCSITEMWWGIVEEGLINPVETVGMRMPVVMVVVTDNCEGWLADFVIKKDGADFNTSIKDKLVGTLPDYYGGGPWEELPYVAAEIWMTTDHAGLPADMDGDYVFTGTLHKDAESINLPNSGSLTVDSKCVAVDPFTYGVDQCFPSVIQAIDDLCCYEGSLDNPQPRNRCEAGDPAYIPCDGVHRCINSDCDTAEGYPSGVGVDDCIDQVIMTASIVDMCTGTTKGTAGCVANIDCSNLEWEECFDCTEGDCVDAGLKGELVTHRAGTCTWVDGVRPEGCSLGLLDRDEYKVCMEEQEFPVFDSWNIIAVLILLTGYYTVIIYRRRR